MKFLFYTQALNKDGHMVEVNVYLDTDACNDIAARAARNVTKKSRSGPVRAEVVRSKK